MTNFLHLTQVLTDMQSDLSREQRFTRDVKTSLMKGLAIVREAIDSVEREMMDAFDERDRAISRILGNSTTFVATISPDDPLGLEAPAEKPKRTARRDESAEKAA